MSRVLHRGLPFNPDWRVHPGRLLREALDERGMTLPELRHLTGVSTGTLSRVCNGKMRFTPALAVVIGEALGIDARIFARMQADYEVGGLLGKVDIDDA